MQHSKTNITWVNSQSERIVNACGITWPPPGILRIVLLIASPRFPIVRKLKIQARTPSASRYKIWTSPHSLGGLPRGGEAMFHPTIIGGLPASALLRKPFWTTHWPIAGGFPTVPARCVSTPAQSLIYSNCSCWRNIDFFPPLFLSWCYWDEHQRWAGKNDIVFISSVIVELVCRVCLTDIVAPTFCSNSFLFYLHNTLINQKYWTFTLQKKTQNALHKV